MVTALYPGSFDPVTMGHLNVATRAARLFDHLIVAVYDTPSKSLLFNTAERVSLMRGAVADVANIEVRPFNRPGGENRPRPGRRHHNPWTAQRSRFRV